MRHELLSHLLEARREKRPVALVTDLESGAQCLLDGETRRGDLAPGEAALAGLRERIAQDASGILPDTRLFVQVFNPPLRLVIIGAVHIAQALVPAARLVGYEVVVVDPRRAWATTTRFPEVDLVIEWPDDALAGLTLDHRTAVVTLTHDPKLDDPALIVAARSPVFFIGALGSTRTHAPFSKPYYLTPGHFAVRRDGGSMNAITRQKIAVQAGSTHEAFLKAHFPKAERVSVKTLQDAQDALANRRADLLFGDRNALLSWLKHDKQAACCQLVGGDYDDATFFSRGAGIVVKLEDARLLAQINQALSEFARDGTEAKIAQRYFGQSIR
jgi:xanthine dehydrogenase accessory factor